MQIVTLFFVSSLVRFSIVENPIDDVYVLHVHLVTWCKITKMCFRYFISTDTPNNSHAEDVLLC